MVKKELPKYEKISLDLAYAIVNCDLEVGQRISGRTVLASKYNVSPETIRKAISILKEHDIVNSSPKNGIEIIDLENAQRFIDNFNFDNNVADIKEEIIDLVKIKEDIDANINNKINLVLDYSTKLKNIGLYHPFELKISEISKLIGKSINEVEFWGMTGATIISIKRNGEIFISPGPKWMFEANDVIVFICSEKDYKKTKKFIVD